MGGNQSEVGMKIGIVWLLHYTRTDSHRQSCVSDATCYVLRAPFDPLCVTKHTPGIFTGGHQSTISAMHSISTSASSGFCLMAIVVRAGL